MARKKRARHKVARHRPSQKKNGMTLAVIGLILNILILPGLGSLIAGKTKIGIWQVALSVIGIILSLIIIGIPILIAAWIWGLITGISLVKEAQ